MGRKQYVSLADNFYLVKLSLTTTAAELAQSAFLSASRARHVSLEIDPGAPLGLVGPEHLSFGREGMRSTA